MIHLRFALLLSALLFVLFPPARAQVSNTAPVLDFESQLVCWDNSGTETTLVRVALYQAGEVAPLTVTYHDLDGTVVDVTGDPVTLGACAGDVTPSVAGMDYIATDLCDSGTPFIRLTLIDESDNSTTDLGDFDLDFAAYTVSGTVTGGPCVTTFESELSYALLTATSGSIAAGKQSISICNAGSTAVELTVDGTVGNLLPGACWSYAAYTDPVTKIFLRAPAVSWNDAGTVSVTSAD